KMGYFDSRDELLDRLDSHYSTAQSKYYSSITSQGNAYTHYVGGEFWDCIYDILLSLMYTNDAIGYLAFQSSGCLREADIIHYLDKFAGGEITYKEICEAWGKDDFEGRVATIAFIDRMRQLLWDEPYQVLWAKKPEEQEF
ncbi:unnamed protein product, partial [marine sediment metagenome]